MAVNEKVNYPEHPWYLDVKIDTIQKAIWAIMCEISYVQKQKSPNLNYTFAGEAALIRALRPYMEKYGVIMSVVDQKDVVFESVPDQVWRSHEPYTAHVHGAFLPCPVRQLISM